MKLEFIKGDHCPICLTTTVIEEAVEADTFTKNKLREHTHGGKWESRKFVCGQRLEYIPNYRETQLSEGYRCHNDPVQIAAIENRKQVKQTIIDFINQMSDADDKLKENMIDGIKRVYIDYPEVTKKVI
jgi:hypothetical protein